MKIAFVIPAYYPALIGESLYAQELAGRLVKMGHEIHVYTNLSSGLKRQETINGVVINRVPVREVMGGKFYFSSQYTRQIMKEKFDVIHSHHYGYFPATAGLIAAKLTKTPHVFGPYYHPPVYGLKRWAQFAIYHATQGLPILRMSDVVLPHTNYEKSMLTKVGGKESNMRLLPNIVDTKRFVPGRKKENIVLFVSSMILEKGAHVAMDIAEEILAERKDIKFVFIGNPYEKSLHPRIEKLRKTGRVKFMKNIRLSELVTWYQRALVSILPSKYEAFARVLAEAQSCGTVVVSTKVGGIPEVVKDGETGYLVDYGSWGQMKDHVRYLLDNPQAAKHMGAKGRQNIEKNFDTGVVVKKLVEIYNEFAK